MIYETKTRQALVDICKGKDRLIKDLVDERDRQDRRLGKIESALGTSFVRATEQLEVNDQDLDTRARQILSNTTYQGCALLAAAYENVNKGLETELKELRESISRPVQQILDAEKELRSRVEELLDENQKLRVRVKKYAAVKYDLEAEVATWHNHCSQASDEVDRLREENQELRAHVEELRSRIEDKTRTILELQQSSSISVRVKRAEETAKAALTENTALRSKLGLRDKTIREMESVQVQCVEDLEKKIEDLERDRDYSRRCAAAWKAEYEQAERALADLRHAHEQSQKTSDWVIDSNQKHIVSMCHMTLEAAVGSIAYCEDGIFPDTIHVEDEGLVYVVAAGSREQNIALLDEARDRVMRYGMPLDDEEPGEEDHAQDRVESMKVPEGEYIVGRTNFEHAVILRVCDPFGVQLGYGEPGQCKLSYKTIEDPRLAQLLYRMAKDRK